MSHESSSSSSSGPMDPSHYVEHVTRTALLLEQLARDVKALREQTETAQADNRALRAAVSTMERDLAVYKVETTSKVGANCDAIEGVVERLKWLSRLVLGALITGLVGGVIGILFKLVAR